jgi:hypothetical protein
LKTTGDVTAEDRIRIDQQLKNWHYQTLWWGAERIWNGELVRLMADGNVFPTGTVPLAADVSESRLFFRITGIFKDTSGEMKDGDAAGAKLNGQLYELIEVERAPAGAVELAEAERKKYPNMPEPPTPDYVFWRHGVANRDQRLDAEYIAGRYYPLPRHLHSQQAIREAFESDETAMADGGEDAPMAEDMRALCLSGIAPAFRLYMKVRSRPSSYFCFG